VRFLHLWLSSRAPALGKIGKPAVGLLLETLKSDNRSALRWIEQALEMIGDLHAEEPLTLALNRCNDADRYAIEQAIKAIRDKAIIDIKIDTYLFGYLGEKF
jgi:HEAT repeat protein